MNIRRWLWLSVLANGVLFLAVVGLIFLLTQLRVDVAEQRHQVERLAAHKIEAEKQLGLLQKQLEIAQKEAAELTAQKQAAEIAVFQPQAQHIQQTGSSTFPISFSFRKALLGSGKVLILENPTLSFVAFSLEVYSPTYHKGRTFQSALSAGKSSEIGHMEGWSFSRGDRLRFESPDFLPYEYTVE